VKAMHNVEKEFHSAYECGIERSYESLKGGAKNSYFTPLERNNV